MNGRSGAARACSPPFTGRIEPHWPTNGDLVPRGIYLSCGDSSITGLADRSIDLVVTDPPFFDNVHYSELADFFFAWQQTGSRSPSPSGSTGSTSQTTRHLSEVQDADADKFSQKLQAVFRECHRVLRDNGLLVFSYHHSRQEGWTSLAKAILGAGFLVVNSQPVKAEMSVATPKSQAKEPIQFDIILVCRRRDAMAQVAPPSESDALTAAQKKLLRLYAEGFTLSLNDRRIVLLGQLLTLLRAPGDFESVARHIDDDIHTLTPSDPVRRRPPSQKLLFEDA